MKLIVGLGNPGDKYARNRHNIGFMVVDKLHDDYGFSNWRGKFQGLLSEGRIVNERCLLLKPETYMNESGRSVGLAAGFYKLEPDDVIVFHDELDLAPGKLRVKTGGGTAGHNGLRSISASPLGNDYVRVRLGIGHPGNKNAVANYVLRDFAKADRDWLDDMIDTISRTAPDLARGDYQQFMSKIGNATANAPASPARTDAPPKPAKPSSKTQASEPAAERSTAIADKLKSLFSSRKDDS